MVRPVLPAFLHVETLSFRSSHFGLLSPTSSPPSLLTTPTRPNPLYRPIRFPTSPSPPPALPVRLQAAAAAPNLYQLLGLTEDVAVHDIKSAYRQMARRYHPDVCADSNIQKTTSRFMEVKEAYETLSDPARRASYDRSISSGSAAAAASAATWGWASEKEAPMEWRYKWEDQLFHMHQKSAAKAAQGPHSWGARMRKQRRARARAATATTRS